MVVFCMVQPYVSKIIQPETKKSLVPICFNFAFILKAEHPPLF